MRNRENKQNGRDLDSEMSDEMSDILEFFDLSFLLA